MSKNKSKSNKEFKAINKESNSNWLQNFQLIDFFKQKPELNFMNSEVYQSKSGVVFTIVFIILSIIIFLLEFMDKFTGKDLEMTKESTLSNSNELINIFPLTNQTKLNEVLVIGNSYYSLLNIAVGIRNKKTGEIVDQDYWRDYINIFALEISFENRTSKLINNYLPLVSCLNETFKLKEFNDSNIETSYNKLLCINSIYSISIHKYMKYSRYLTFKVLEKQYNELSDSSSINNKSLLNTIFFNSETEYSAKKDEFNKDHEIIFLSQNNQPSKSISKDEKYLIKSKVQKFNLLKKYYQKSENIVSVMKVNYLNKYLKVINFYDYVASIFLNIENSYTKIIKKDYFASNNDVGNINNDNISFLVITFTLNPTKEIHFITRKDVFIQILIVVSCMALMYYIIKAVSNIYGSYQYYLDLINKSLYLIGKNFENNDNIDFDIFLKDNYNKFIEKYIKTKEFSEKYQKYKEKSILLSSIKYSKQKVYDRIEIIQSNVISNSNHIVNTNETVLKKFNINLNSFDENRDIDLNPKNKGKTSVSNFEKLIIIEGIEKISSHSNQKQNDNNDEMIIDENEKIPDLEFKLKSDFDRYLEIKEKIVSKKSILAKLYESSKNILKNLSIDKVNTIEALDINTFNDSKSVYFNYQKIEDILSLTKEKRDKILFKLLFEKEKKTIIINEYHRIVKELRYNKMKISSYEKIISGANKFVRNMHHENSIDIDILIKEDNSDKKINATNNLISEDDFNKILSTNYNRGLKESTKNIENKFQSKSNNIKIVVENYDELKNKEENNKIDGNIQLTNDSSDEISIRKENKTKKIESKKNVINLKNENSKKGKSNKNLIFFKDIDKKDGEIKNKEITHKKNMYKSNLNVVNSKSRKLLDEFSDKNDRKNNKFDSNKELVDVNKDSKNFLLLDKIGHINKTNVIQNVKKFKKLNNKNLIIISDLEVSTSNLENSFDFFERFFETNSFSTLEYWKNKILYEIYSYHEIKEFKLTFWEKLSFIFCSKLIKNDILRSICCFKKSTMLNLKEKLMMYESSVMKINEKLSLKTFYEYQSKVETIKKLLFNQDQMYVYKIALDDFLLLENNTNKEDKSYETMDILEIDPKLQDRLKEILDQDEILYFKKFYYIKPIILTIMSKDNNVNQGFINYLLNMNVSKESISNFISEYQKIKSRILKLNKKIVRTEINEHKITRIIESSEI